MVRLNIAFCILALALPTATLADQKPAPAPDKHYTSFAGVNLVLPIPAGYCEIPRSGEGLLFHKLQDHNNTGTNVVAMLFANCKEWKLRAADPNYRLRRHGSYLLQLTEGAQQLAPREYTRARYIGELSGMKFDMEELRKGINQKVDTSGLDTGKLNTLSIRPIAFDARGAYLMGVSEVQFPSGKTMVAVAVGATLVKGAPISINLYGDYKDTASLLAMVEEQKRNLARLDQANP